MPNKNYQSGRSFEYRVKKYFEKQGYYVMRSAGSKSPFDLIAIETNYTKGKLISTHILLIQCKHGSKVLPKERLELFDLERDMIGVTCFVAYSKSNGPIEFYEWLPEGFDKWKWTKIE